MNFRSFDRILLDDMLGYDHALLADKVFGVGNVKRSQVEENNDSSRVECEDSTGLLDIRHGNGVEAEADGLPSSQKASVYSLPRKSVSNDQSGNRSELGDLELTA